MEKLQKLNGMARSLLLFDKKENKVNQTIRIDTTEGEIKIYDPRADTELLPQDLKGRIIDEIRLGRHGLIILELKEKED